MRISRPFDLGVVRLQFIAGGEATLSFLCGFGVYCCASERHAQCEFWSMVRIEADELRDEGIGRKD